MFAFSLLLLFITRNYAQLPCFFYQYAHYYLSTCSLQVIFTFCYLPTVHMLFLSNLRHLPLKYSYTHLVIDSIFTKHCLYVRLRVIITLPIPFILVITSLSRNFRTYTYTNLTAPASTVQPTPTLFTLQLCPVVCSLLSFYDDIVTYYILCPTRHTHYQGLVHNVLLIV